MKPNSENIQNFESVVFNAEYQEIVNTSISPSNILSFYERALVKLIALTEKVVRKYTSRNPTTLTGKALEDAAYSDAGLSNITATLEAIEERQTQLHTLQTHIESELHVSNKVFVPPSEENRYAIQPGSGKGIEEKLIFPRLLTLLYILENDLDIHLSASDEEEQAIEVVQGSVTDSMMRTHPYVRVSIPELNRIIYLCDEEGNASFVFDQAILDREDISTETLDTTDKTVFNELFTKHPELGMRIIYNKDTWRANILEALQNNFTVKEKAERKSPSRKQKSDFAARESIPLKKEGWESANSLYINKKVLSDPTTLKLFAETFRADHPEWFERQRSLTGMLGECYHPELVRLIKEHYAN